MWTDITTGKITHILHVSNNTDTAMEDNTASYSPKLTLHLHPTYALFYSRLNFNFFSQTLTKKKTLRIFSNSFKFISWTTAVTSLMAVLLPVCPIDSGTEETPNSASVNNSEFYNTVIVIIQLRSLSHKYLNYT